MDKAKGLHGLNLWLPEKKHVYGNFKPRNWNSVKLQFDTKTSRGVRTGHPDTKRLTHDTLNSTTYFISVRTLQREDFENVGVTEEKGP